MDEKIVDINGHRNENEKNKKVKGHGSRFLIWLLMLVIVLGGVLYILVDMAVIRDVMVSGNSHYSREEVIALLDMKADANIVDVYFGKEIDISNYPYIKSVDISYEGLNYIRVIVEEKEIISYVKYQNNYLALDKDGYLVDYLESIEDDIPIVKGLYIQSAIVGQKLEVEESVVNTLLDLHHLRTKYNVGITTIEFPFSDGSMLHIYVKEIKIIMGKPQELDMKMKNAGEVLKKLSSDLSGTLDIQEDKERFIFKKNMD